MFFDEKYAICQTYKLVYILEYNTLGPPYVKTMTKTLS